MFSGESDYRLSNPFHCLLYEIAFLAT